MSIYATKTAITLRTVSSSDWKLERGTSDTEVQDSKTAKGLGYGNIKQFAITGQGYMKPFIPANTACEILSYINQNDLKNPHLYIDGSSRFMDKIHHELSSQLRERADVRELFEMYQEFHRDEHEASLGEPIDPKTLEYWQDSHNQRNAG